MSATKRRASVGSVLGGVVVTLLVWLTVGKWAAVAAAVLLLWDVVAAPSRKVLATASVALLVALPLVWLLGSSLPLSTPSLRLQDNVAAHQLGGLAIWMLFVAAWRDVSPLERSQR